jgi:arginine utilization protein RocB
MARGRHIKYPEKEKDGEVKRLRDCLKRKQKEIDKLKSELKTYEAAFQKNIQFLKGKTKDLSLKELLEGAKNEDNLKKIEENKEMTFKEMEDRWKCFKCGKGMMKLIIFNKVSEKWYFRSCTNKPQCTHRTEAQKFHDNVEGVGNESY